MTADECRPSSRRSRWPPLPGLRPRSRGPGCGKRDQYPPPGLRRRWNSSSELVRYGRTRSWAFRCAACGPPAATRCHQPPPGGRRCWRFLRREGWPFSAYTLPWSRAWRSARSGHSVRPRSIAGARDEVGGLGAHGVDVGIDVPGSCSPVRIPTDPVPVQVRLPNRAGHANRPPGSPRRTAQPARRRSARPPTRGSDARPRAGSNAARPEGERSRRAGRRSPG